MTLRTNGSQRTIGWTLAGMALAASLASAQEAGLPPEPPRMAHQTLGANAEAQGFARELMRSLADDGLFALPEGSHLSSVQGRTDRRRGFQKYSLLIENPRYDALVVELYTFSGDGAEERALNFASGPLFAKRQERALESQALIEVRRHQVLVVQDYAKLFDQGRGSAPDELPGLDFAEDVAREAFQVTGNNGSPSFRTVITSPGTHVVVLPEAAEELTARGLAPELEQALQTEPSKRSRGDMLYARADSEEGQAFVVKYDRRRSGPDARAQQTIPTAAQRGPALGLVDQLPD